MQTIQDQQHSILTTVLPLLPLIQAFPLHVDQAKASIADNVLFSLSNLSRDIDSMKSTLSSLSAPSNSIRSTSQSAIAENHPTRKRTNSWLNQDDTLSGRSQSKRPHSVAPEGSPRIDRHKKPRLESISPTGSPQLVKQSSRTAISREKHALNLRKSLNADRLTSSAGGSVTNNNYPAAPRPNQITRTPLADILSPAPLNHASAQLRKLTAEPPSSSGPRAIFSSNAQRMRASPEAGRRPLSSAPVHEAIPPASMAAPDGSNISTAVPNPDNVVPPTSNQKDRKKTMELAPVVPPIPPQPISKAIKLEEVLRSPLKCYISIPLSPLSSLSPSPPLAPPQPVLKTQARHAAGGIARRQVTFATSSQVFIPSNLSGPGIPPLPTLDSTSASMSLRDRRVQMSMLGRTASSAKRFIPLGSSSDEEG
ncbi:hypothetical protein DFH29DRAFT_268532 [Suillus ampliporus]|nr:hypothetical protein DFH29DRAFT_268532 [Suillus ampliporus]